MDRGTDATDEQERAADGLPPVSCICLTYGRPQALEEAIYSFLQQDYAGVKELIVLNDHAGQTLHFDHPEVRIVNLPYRFHTVGEKMNAAAALCSHGIVFVWDDDDVYLPHRISFSVEHFDREKGFFTTGRAWHWDYERIIHLATSWFHSGSCWSRELFDLVGGYPATGNGYDIVIEQRFEAARPGSSARHPIRDEEAFYVYRWSGNNSYHMSAFALDNPGQNVEQADVTRYVAEQIARGDVQSGEITLRPHWSHDYPRLVREFVAAGTATPAADATIPTTHPISIAPAVVPPGRTATRAIVCFVEGNPHLIQQLLALRHSWLYANCPDTDLVVMGPDETLARLPDDLVKIAQRPAADDPSWDGYRYANSIACMNGAGAERLEQYGHLLRSDVDTLITPAWNGFRPAGFLSGHGGYSNDDTVRANLRAISRTFGLTHRGVTNIGSTWYGPAGLIRRVAALTETLTQYIVQTVFGTEHGAWPGWYKGVSLLYGAEIAVNHLVENVEKTSLLDAFSTSPGSIHDVPHIHCWHTDELFSKHWFMSGRYRPEEWPALDLSVVREYCLEMSFRSAEDLKLIPRRDLTWLPSPTR